MMRRRIAAAFVATTAVAALFACNAIIGVEDVRLRRDSGFFDDEDVEDIDSSSPPPDLFQVALGERHTCAKKVGGAVRCWGDDTQGQTGAGVATDGGFLDEPTDVANLDDALEIAAGKLHSCAVRRSGEVSCWGFNLDGQLGNGETNSRSATPVDVSGLSDARAIAAGGNFSCAVRANGRVVCWGGNASGQLGDGSLTPSATPVTVRDISDAIGVAAGEAHACAVTSEGGIFCWGDGRNGQLGTGMSVSSPTPQPVVAIPQAVAVTAGERSSCSLARSGAVHCWGANELGQLGSGTPSVTPNPTPVPVTGLEDASSIFMSKNHACAVRRSGNVVCWGAGASGQLGDGQPRTDASAAQATFVRVSGITNGEHAGAGGFHSCATTRVGGILCWGSNDRGQLGNRSTTSEQSPVAVVGYP